MAGKIIVSLTAASGLALSGCVAGMVASAAGSAIQASRGQPQSNQHLQPAARQACTASAAPHGAVHIIDVVQSSVDRIVVWGTVDNGQRKQSFECGFKTAVTYFKLREIRR
jgi:hypothetical protein